MTDAPSLARPTLAWLHLSAHVADDAPYTANPDEGVLGEQSRNELTRAEYEIARLQGELAAPGPTADDGIDAMVWGKETMLEAWAHDRDQPPDATRLRAVAQRKPAIAADMIRVYAAHGAAAAPLIAPLLAHPEWHPRRAAVDELGALGYVESLDSLCQIVQTDPEPFVRKSAAIALAKLATADSSVAERVRRALRATMHEDPAKGVRLAAERALGRIGE